MSEIFLVVLKLHYEGRTLKQFNEVLMRQAVDFSASAADDKIMKILATWMVVGENTMYLFVEGCGDLLDRFLIRTPIIKELGSQIDRKVISLYAYETFGNSLNKMFGKNKTYEESTTTSVVDNDNTIYYLLEVDIEQRGLSQEALVDIWLEEIEAALMAKKANRVVDLWKAVAMRKVFVLLCVDCPSTMDMTSFRFPMAKQMGDNLSITTRRLCNFQTFADNLKEKM